MKKLLMCLALLSACSGKGVDHPDTFDTSEFSAKKAELTDYLFKHNNENGWVVSRDKESGELKDIGDSAIWTGIAMASVGCGDGAVFQKALGETIKNRKGLLVRFEPFEEHDLTDGYSLDGEIGIMTGFVFRSLKCPNEHEALGKLWKTHYDYVKANGGLLHPTSEFNTIPIGIDYIWEGVAWHFGLRGKPHKDGRAALAPLLSGWALATAAAERSCFRVHLATLNAILGHYMGIPLSDNGKSLYCSSTGGFKNSLADWYCDRQNSQAWLTDYKQGEFYNAHQRCMRWQEPDGDPTRYEPPLDFLFLLTLVNDLKE